MASIRPAWVKGPTKTVRLGPARGTARGFNPQSCQKEGDLKPTHTSLKTQKPTAAGKGSGRGTHLAELALKCQARPSQPHCGPRSLHTHPPGSICECARHLGHFLHLQGSEGQNHCCAPCD